MEELIKQHLKVQQKLETAISEEAAARRKVMESIQGDVIVKFQGQQVKASIKTRVISILKQDAALTIKREVDNELWGLIIIPMETVEINAIQQFISLGRIDKNIIEKITTTETEQELTYQVITDANTN